MEERLQSYNKIKAEIKRLEYEIKKLENEEYGVGSSNLEITGIKPKGYMQSGAENKLVNNQDKINMYKRQIEELEAEIEYIDAQLKLLNSIEAQVIRLKYFENQSLNVISENVERDESTIIRIINRAIVKMQ